MLNDYFGVWSLARGFEGLAEQAARAPARKAAPPSLDAERDDGVAVLRVGGLLTKYGGPFGTGSKAAADEVRALAADTNAKQIVMVFDSPGGTVSGTDDFAQAVREAASRKPVIAYCEDLCASAAYWVASQCSRVYVNRSGRVGGVGVYRLVYDDSAAFGKEGVKAHLVKSAEFKGAGAPGVPVTDAHLSEWQRQVDDVHRAFTAAVQGARPSVKAAALDGRTFGATEAVRLGLIDGVANLDDLLAGQEPAAGAAGAAATGKHVASVPASAPTDTRTAAERALAWIAARVAAGDSRATATSALKRDEPALHRAWLEEATQAARAAAARGRRYG